MNEQEHVHEIHDGRIVDMRMEYLLAWTLAGQHEAHDYDDLFTNVVREFINPDTPHIVASFILATDVAAEAVEILQMLGLDFRVAFPAGRDWPEGGFPYLEGAKCAISLSRGDETWGEFSPGVGINQAVLAAIVQLARDISMERLNQPELTFH